ncbi:MAG: hypothetical protein KDA21_13565, partial [Phycisphaerales bacterium]|nr:hypothetical protein [Phycisphaerales bacterium]
VTFQPRPHTSAALQHLRFGVTSAAAVAAVCLLLQMLVWAFVHYTNVQWVEPEVRNAAQQHVIVGAETAPAKDHKPAGGAAADVNRVESRNGRILRATASLAQTFGIISATTLATLMLLGTVIAGGSHVPGVEKVVTATTWSIAVAGFCLPLGSLMPEAVYPGVFISFDHLTEAAASYHAGGEAAPGAFGYHLIRVALPVVFILTLILVVVRFRSGVEAGVIVTSVSQLDEKLEKEIRAMKLGQLASPRSVGALNSAIGDQTPEVPVSPAPAPTPRPTGTDGFIGMQRPI